MAHLHTLLSCKSRHQAEAEESHRAERAARTSRKLCTPCDLWPQTDTHGCKKTTKSPIWISSRLKKLNILLSLTEKHLYFTFHFTASPRTPRLTSFIILQNDGSEVSLSLFCFICTFGDHKQFWSKSSHSLGSICSNRQSISILMKHQGYMTSVVTCNTL